MKVCAPCFCAISLFFDYVIVRVYSVNRQLIDSHIHTQSKISFTKINSSAPKLNVLRVFFR